MQIRMGRQHFDDGEEETRKTEIAPTEIFDGKGT